VPADIVEKRGLPDPGPAHDRQDLAIADMGRKAADKRPVFSGKADRDPL
jgi:hypothetical protein